MHTRRIFTIDFLENKSYKKILLYVYLFLRFFIIYFSCRTYSFPDCTTDVHANTLNKSYISNVNNCVTDFGVTSAGLNIAYKIEQYFFIIK